MSDTRTHHHVAIVGAGFGGIGASIKLFEAGEIDQIIFEKQTDVGGTWLANRYPGCRCDVASNLYSYSFAPNPDWSDTYSSREEIWSYLRGVAEEYGVMARIRFGTEVLEAGWSDRDQHWILETGGGRHTADVLVWGGGLLSEPAVPSFDGLERFAGPVVHSARWDPDRSLSARRVAVVGTGASAVQIVPRVHDQAGQLFVFQRTPAWILPHPGRRVREWQKKAYRRWPVLQKISRDLIYYRAEFLLVPALTRSRRLGLLRKLSLEQLERQVPDPGLRAKLTPDFAPGCKRLTPSNDYLPAIASPRTELVTSGIDHFDETGVVTADGVHRDVDVVILATGFRVTNATFPARIVGRQGRTLREVWDADSMAAYKGTTVARFPNLFLLAGPNTGIGHTSLLYMIEAQLPYVTAALKYMRDHDLAAVEVRPDVQVAWNESLQRRFANSVWTTGGCSSWYLDGRGRNTTLWPDFTFHYARQLRRFDAESYYQEASRTREPVPA